MGVEHRQLIRPPAPTTLTRVYDNIDLGNEDEYVLVRSSIPVAKAKTGDVRSDRVGIFSFSNSRERHSHARMMDAWAAHHHDLVEDYGRPLLASEKPLIRASAQLAISYALILNRSQFEEAAVLLKQFLESGLYQERRVSALLALGQCNLMISRFKEAGDAYNGTLAILAQQATRSLDDIDDEATATAGLAIAYSEQGYYEAAHAELSRSDELAVASGSLLRTATNNMHRAEMLRQQNAFGQAIEAASEAVEQFSMLTKQSAGMVKAGNLDTAVCRIVAARSQAALGNPNQALQSVSRIRVEGDLPPELCWHLRLCEFDIAAASVDLAKTLEIESWFEGKPEVGIQIRTELNMSIGMHRRRQAIPGASEPLRAALVYYEQIDHQVRVAAVRGLLQDEE